LLYGTFGGLLVDAGTSGDGLLGWAALEFVEFGLYIPALAWTAFFVFGWLHSVARNEFDSDLRRT